MLIIFIRHLFVFLQEYEDAVLTFSETSKNIPDSDELFLIYANGLTQPYLLTVRAMKGTPFAGVTEGLTERVQTSP